MNNATWYVCMYFCHDMCIPLYALHVHARPKISPIQYLHKRRHIHTQNQPVISILCCQCSCSHTLLLTYRNNKKNVRTSLQYMHTVCNNIGLNHDALLKVRTHRPVHHCVYKQVRLNALILSFLFIRYPLINISSTTEHWAVVFASISILWYCFLLARAMIVRTSNRSLYMWHLLLDNSDLNHGSAILLAATPWIVVLTACNTIRTCALSTSFLSMSSLLQHPSWQQGSTMLSYLEQFFSHWYRWNDGCFEHQQPWLISIIINTVETYSRYTMHNLQTNKYCWSEWWRWRLIYS